MAGALATDKKEIAARRVRAKEWKALREKNLLSLSGLASVLGVSRDTIWLIENERVTPQRGTQAKFKALQKTYLKESKR